MKLSEYRKLKSSAYLIEQVSEQPVIPEDDAKR